MLRSVAAHLPCGCANPQAAGDGMGLATTNRFGAIPRASRAGVFATQLSRVPQGVPSAHYAVAAIALTLCTTPTTTQALSRVTPCTPVLPAVTVSLKDLVAATSVEVAFLPSGRVGDTGDRGRRTAELLHNPSALCAACVTDAEAARTDTRSSVDACNPGFRCAAWTQVRSGVIGRPATTSATN